MVFPGADTITIDTRIVGDVGVYNAERIIVDQGDNVFNLRFNPNDLAAATTPGTTNFSVDGVTVGLLNGNIKLGGFSEIYTGDGNDTFNINQDWEYDLTVEAGGGDDVFRFLSSQGVANDVRHNADGTTEEFVEISTTTPTPNNDDPLALTIVNLDDVVQRQLPDFYGQAGNDRFVFRGIVSDGVEGGEGDDVIDYTLSQAGDLSFTIGGNSSPFRQFQFNAERVIGSAGGVNSVTSIDGSTQNWFVNGNRTRLVDLTTRESVVFENFTNFRGNQNGGNSFYVLRTAADIQIENASWVQFSSELDPLQGNLDLIQHDVAVVDSRPSLR